MRVLHADACPQTPARRRPPSPAGLARARARARLHEVAGGDSLADVGVVLARVEVGGDQARAQARRDAHLAPPAASAPSPHGGTHRWGGSPVAMRSAVHWQALFQGSAAAMPGAHPTHNRLARAQGQASRMQLCTRARPCCNRRAAAEHPRRLAHSAQQARRARRPGRGARQLAAHAVRGLDRAVVEEVVVAPLGRLAVLLVRVVHVEQRQVVACAAPARVLTTPPSRDGPGPCWRPVRPRPCVSDSSHRQFARASCVQRRQPDGCMSSALLQAIPLLRAAAGARHQYA